MLGQIEVGPVGDALKLVPAPRIAVLQVGRASRIVRELLGRVNVAAEVGWVDTKSYVPLFAQVDPAAVPLVRLIGRDEVLHLHLLEFARAEDEVAQGDLVAERLALLSDAKGQPTTGRREHVLEVDEDALRGLGPQIGLRARPGNRANLGTEHEVELARLGELADHATSRACRTLEMVRTEALLALEAIDHRVVKVLHMAGRFPDARGLDDRGVKADDIGAFTHGRAPPELFDVALQLDAERSVVVGRSEPAVDLRGGKHEPALLTQRNEGVEGDFCSGGHQHRLSGGAIGGRIVEAGIAASVCGRDLMRFLIGLILGLLVGAVLTVLATGNAGRALQEQIREQTERGDGSTGDGAPAR